MTTVGLDIQPVQMCYRRFAGSAILDHPAAKLLDRLEVEVERLSANAAFHVAVRVSPVRTQPVQVFHDSASRKVWPSSEATAVQDSSNPSTDQLDMTIR